MSKKIECPYPHDGTAAITHVHSQFNDFGEPFECLQKGSHGNSSSNPKILTSDEIESIANALAIPLKTSTHLRNNKKSPKILIQNIIRVLENL